MNSKIIIIYISLFIIVLSSFSFKNIEIKNAGLDYQDPIDSVCKQNWRKLFINSYKSINDSITGETNYLPIFTKQQEELDGKEIVLCGYINFNIKKDKYGVFIKPLSGIVFDPNLMNSVQLDKADNLECWGYIAVKGTLVLNRDNPDDFPFILKDYEINQTEK
mgnify:CR=1 FL=1